MRILVVTNLFPNPCQPNRAPWNRLQLAAFAENHPLRVIAPILWTDELRAYWQQGMRMPADRKSTIDRVTVEYPRYYYTPKILRTAYGWFFMKSVRAYFEKAVEEFRPDLVFAPWAYPDGWAAIRLARPFGLPVVVKVHGSDILTLDRYPERRAPTIECVRAADAIVAVSNDLRNELLRLGCRPECAHVVYNGVDLCTFHPGNRTEARQRLGMSKGPSILYVGNLVAVKQVHVLIDAMAELARDGSAIQCHLVGDGPLRGQLSRQAEYLGLGERVIFHGSRPHAELATWYRAADVVVLPSRSEGVPNVVLEAMACDIPVVASRVGGIPEIANDESCILVPPGDATAIANAVAAALLYRPNRCHNRSIEDSAHDLGRVFRRVLRKCPGVPEPVGAK
jgi:glycosyltransferase involved in cell wall biosynthesis